MILKRPGLAAGIKTSRKNSYLNSGRFKLLGLCLQMQVGVLTVLVCNKGVL